MEKKQLMEVVDSDILFYFSGRKVYEFQDKFTKMYNMKHCISCSSGTAAVHMAVAALAQLDKLSDIVKRRRELGDTSTKRLQLVEGLIPPAYS